MKIQKSNLGKALSREEMKNVKGGAPYCYAGSTISCHCLDGKFVNVINQADYYSNPILYCTGVGACAKDGGRAIAATCNSAVS